MGYYENEEMENLRQELIAKRIAQLAKKYGAHQGKFVAAPDPFPEHVHVWSYVRIGDVVVGSTCQICDENKVYDDEPEEPKGCLGCLSDDLSHTCGFDENEFRRAAYGRYKHTYNKRKY